MAITWAALAMGFVAVFVIPMLVVGLNVKKSGLGWKFLGAIILFIAVGNILEMLMEK